MVHIIAYLFYNMQEENIKFTHNVESATRSPPLQMDRHLAQGQIAQNFRRASLSPEVFLRVSIMGAYQYPANRLALTL